MVYLGFQALQMKKEKTTLYSKRSHNKTKEFWMTSKKILKLRKLNQVGKEIMTNFLKRQSRKAQKKTQRHLLNFWLLSFALLRNFKSKRIKFYNDEINLPNKMNPLFKIVELEKGKWKWRKLFFYPCFGSMELRCPFFYAYFHSLPICHKKFGIQIKWTLEIYVWNSINFYSNKFLVTLYLHN